MNDVDLDQIIAQKTGELASLERCIDQAKEDFYHSKQRQQYLTQEIQNQENRLRHLKWLYAYAEGVMRRYGLMPEESMSDALERAQAAFAKSNPGELPGDDALNPPAPAKSTTGRRRRIEITIPLDEEDEPLY